MIFVDFRPAEYHPGNCSYVAYYVKNPETGRLVRKRIKLNRVKGVRNRDRFASRLCAEVNQKLYEGWNPFLENDAYFSGTSLKKGLEEFYEEKSRQLRDDTLRGYRSYIKWLMGNLNKSQPEKLFLPIKTFSQKDAERLMKSLGSRQDITPSTYNSYLEFFRSLFNHFKTRNWLKENPFSWIPRRKVGQKMRDLIPADIRQQITDYFIETDQVPYLYVMQLCFRCLIRPKEILMLKIKDIDFSGNMLTIPSEAAKNHKARTVGVPEGIMSYFQRVRGFDPEHYIFSEGYLPGTVLKNSKYTSQTWAKMRKELKLPMRFQFYSLKDTGITEMLESGVPAKFVKELADHSSLEVTERYMHKTEAKVILQHNTISFCTKDAVEMI